LKAYARTTKAPSLWIYASNDSYVKQADAKIWHAAYLQAGGRAEFFDLGVHGKEGHNLHNCISHATTWPRVERFLSANQLPISVKHAIQIDPLVTIPKHARLLGLATQEQLGTFGLRVESLERLISYLNQGCGRSLAVAKNGAWKVQSGASNSSAVAKTGCQQYGQPCSTVVYDAYIWNNVARTTN
jgi:hypothetical protein